MPASTRRLTAVAAATALAVVPAYALAATKNGVTPTSPKAGGVVKQGKSVTFSGRVRGSGSVFVHVCKSSKKSARTGLICAKADIGQAKKRDGRFSYAAKTYAFDEHWLNTPGTYYWQAHRIAANPDKPSDPRFEGPVVRFRVR